MGAAMLKQKKPELAQARSGSKDATIPEPEIPSLDSPHPGWKRLAIAPFHYQADEWNYKIYASEDGGRWQLSQLLRRFPLLQSVETDKNLGVLLVEFPPVVTAARVETRSSQHQVYPADVQRGRPLEFATWDPLPSEFGHEFASAITELWKNMEGGFRHAHKGGFCRVMARTGSPAAKFVEIPPDSFAHFRIVDWNTGLAATSSGYEIFSIHAADPVEHPDYINSPLYAYRKTLEKRPAMAGVVAYVLERYPAGKVTLSYDALTQEIKEAVIKKERKRPGDGAKRNPPDERTVREGYKLAMEIAPHVKESGKIGMLGLPDFP
jgi:hypothetical protein